MNPLEFSFQDHLQTFIKESIKGYLSTQEGKEFVLSIVKDTKETPVTVDLDQLIEKFPCLKKSTVYKKTASGEFPHSTMGTKLVFNVAEVEAYISKSKKESKEDLKAKVLTQDFNKRSKRNAA